MKIKITTLTRYLYYFFVALVVLSLGINFLFLYNDFYRTLIQAEIIYLLKDDVYFEKIDSQLWNSVWQNLENKKSQTQIETGLKNPFTSLSVPSESSE